MEIRKTYKGINEDGHKAIWCGFKPDNAQITEELLVLVPKDGYELVNKETKERSNSFVLERETDIENFEEVIEDGSNSRE